MLYGKTNENVFKKLLFKSREKPLDRWEDIDENIEPVLTDEGLFIPILVNMNGKKVDTIYSLITTEILNEIYTKCNKNNKYKFIKKLFRIGG